MTDVSILELDRGEVMRAFPAIGEVYNAAFRVPDPAMTQRFLDHSLSNHVSYPEFRLQVAAMGREIIGFAYGYRSEPGRWWHDTVGPAIVREAGPEWLEDPFEFVEFAVLPEWQGRGIGGALHDGLLGAVPQARALLSTDAAGNPAREFYRLRGWIDLVPAFTYPGGAKPAALMGLDLQTWRKSQVDEQEHVE